jgi:hypothetical protein
VESNTIKITGFVLKKFTSQKLKLEANDGTFA